MNPLTANRALDQYFLDVRCRILDVAASLDRISRGGNAGEVASDARMERIRAALDVLSDSSGDRAERIQQIFSLDYDPSWEKPKPRY